MSDLKINNEYLPEPDKTNYLDDAYRNFIHLAKYARWDDEKGRRETWPETVDRLISFWKKRFPHLINVIPFEEIRYFILTCKVMPSMRSMMTAGKALDENEIAGYNCAAIAVNNKNVFDTILFILMHGVGVGFSVERQYISNLPTVPNKLEYIKNKTIVVDDSKEGWAHAYRELICSLYDGEIPDWDISKIRPAGARLKTFGGRASGGEVLSDLFDFTVSVFKKSKGRKLTSIDCHDIICKIAEIVIVGSVRRSALISLSNLSDLRMRKAKSGEWGRDNPQRRLANNSVCYTEKPDIGVFMEEWISLYRSKSGERGIFNREAANFLIPERRKALGFTDWLCNPCSEILLRSTGQFCNLTSVVIRPEDTPEDLLKKIEIATILGTLQASLTDFKYIDPDWSENTKLEALLGVSLNGIMDNKLTSGRDINSNLEDLLQQFTNKAIEVNKHWSKIIGINQATAITAVKPEGTTSQLVNCSSGIHPRFSPYYIRSVRSDKKDPLAKMMVDAGFPYEDDAMKPESGYVFFFPIKSPEDSIFVKDVSALEQLELWKKYQLFYTEHKPSITVYVKEDEWLQVGSWVYDNFNIVSGVSFLPHSDHVYKQAPYTQCTEEEYYNFCEKMPKDVDWSKLSDYELEDSTTSIKEFACTGGQCDLV